MAHANINIKLDLDNVEITEELRQAFEALADVMHVQAEDGLYLGGHEEAFLEDETETGRIVENTFFGHFNYSQVTVEIEA